MIITNLCLGFESLTANGDPACLHAAYCMITTYHERALQRTANNLVVSLIAVYPSPHSFRWTKKKEKKACCPSTYLGKSRQVRCLCVPFFEPGACTCRVCETTIIMPWAIFFNPISGLGLNQDLPGLDRELILNHLVPNTYYLPCLFSDVWAAMFHQRRHIPEAFNQPLPVARLPPSLGTNS